jgi:hypothetical protein
MTFLTSKGKMIKCLPFKKPFINVDLTLIKTTNKSRQILDFNISPISSFLPQAAETKYTFQLTSVPHGRDVYIHFTVYSRIGYVDLIII